METLGDVAAIDPIYVTLAAILVVGALSGWVLRSALAAREAGDPLKHLFVSDRFDAQLDDIAARPVYRRSRRPVPPQGARAQMERLREVREVDTRAEAIEEVARVMRAGSGRDPAPVRVIDEAPAIATSEWEEVKLLPPPASEAA